MLISGGKCGYVDVGFLSRRGLLMFQDESVAEFWH